MIAPVEIAILELGLNISGHHKNRGGHRRKHKELSEEAKAILRKSLQLEYEFYDFIHSRLKKQHNDLKSLN